MKLTPSKARAFWLVEPQIDLQGISGLSTLRDGIYIAIDPGPTEAEPINEFKALTRPPAGINLTGLSFFSIVTSQLGQLGLGDHIFFRGLPIGQVIGVSLSKAATQAVIQIGIQKRYLHLVRDNSVFWRKQAVQAKMGLFGAEIKVGAMDSFLKGGIDMATPDKPGPLAKAGTDFSLLEDPPKDSKKWQPTLN